MLLKTVMSQSSKTTRCASLLGQLEKEERE